MYASFASFTLLLCVDWPLCLCRILSGRGGHYAYLDACVCTWMYHLHEDAFLSGRAPTKKRASAHNVSLVQMSTNTEKGTPKPFFHRAVESVFGSPYEKSVSFEPFSDAGYDSDRMIDETEELIRQQNLRNNTLLSQSGRLRSGLPYSYPAKFPSPKRQPCHVDIDVISNDIRKNNVDMKTLLSQLKALKVVDSPARDEWVPRSTFLQLRNEYISELTNCSKFYDSFHQLVLKYRAAKEKAFSGAQVYEREIQSLQRSNKELERQQELYKIQIEEQQRRIAQLESIRSFSEYTDESLRSLEDKYPDKKR